MRSKSCTPQDSALKMFFNTPKLYWSKKPAGGRECTLSRGRDFIFAYGACLFLVLVVDVTMGLRFLPSYFGTVGNTEMARFFFFGFYPR